MAVIAALNPTLADVAKVMGPDGRVVSDIVDMLSEDNPIIEDATFLEANNTLSHRTSMRTGLPAPTWRRFYQGVQPSKSTYAQVDEPLGMMEARSQIDQDLADMATDRAAFMLMEAGGHIEGMRQAFAETLLYGNVSTSPEKFNGIIPRLNSLSAISGENIIDAGGTGSDNTSILIIKWSPRTVFCAYPRGSQAGIKRTPIGLNHQAEPPDGTSGKFSAYEEKFEWKCGCVVRDWRAVVRIANIDVSNLVDQSNAPALLELIAVAMDKLPSGTGRTVIYVNRTVSSMLRIQTMKQANVYLTPGQEEGQRKTSFDGVPIRIVDELLNTEARVT